MRSKFDTRDRRAGDVRADLEFDAEHELELSIEAEFYYAPPVPLRRESTRCPDAQPVPRRAAASFNKRVETNRSCAFRLRSWPKNSDGYRACVSTVSGGGSPLAFSVDANHD
jgi:hypothetical protein